METIGRLLKAVGFPISPATQNVLIEGTLIWFIREFPKIGDPNIVP